MTKKSRAKRKSAPEQIAFQKAKLAKMEARESLKDARDNPALSPLVDVLDTLTKQSIEYTKGFGSGPQSFDARIMSKQLWIDEIDAQRAFAVVALDGLKTQQAFVKDALGVVATDIANGASTSTVKSAVAEAIADIPPLDEDATAEAQKNLNDLTALRKAYTFNKKLSKKAQEANAQ